VAERAGARGPISWGDAVTAAAVLGIASSEDFEFLVDLLGLTFAAVRNEEPWDSTSHEGRPPGPIGASGRGWTTPPPSRDELAVPQDRRTVVIELESQPFDVAVDLAEPLDSPPPGMPPIPYEPPVPDRLLRASMSMLVRRLRSSDELAVDEVIDLVAEQRPLVDLPRLDERTTQRGVTVVADVGHSMLPFLADVDRLVAEILHVVGSPNAEVWWVDDDTPLAEWAEAEPILGNSRPVLVISTLGAVRAPGSPPESCLRWLGFADHADGADADVVGLVPHRLRAWPRPIARAINLVAWDDLPQVGRGHV